MFQFIDQTVYNIVKNGNYLFNAQYAPVATLNTALTSLLTTVSTLWQTYAPSDQLAVLSLVPDIIISSIQFSTVFDPMRPNNNIVVQPDATSLNGAQATANAFITTDYICGTTHTFPQISGHTTIVNGVPSVYGYSYPTYTAPAFRDFISIIGIMEAVFPNVGEPVTTYLQNPTQSLIYATIGSIAGSIVDLVSSLTAAATMLNTVLSGAGYRPSQDATWSAKVGVLQSAAAALNARLQLEINNYLAYVVKLHSYQEAIQLLLSFQDPDLQPVISMVITNPNLNPDLNTALLALQKTNK